LYIKSFFFNPNFSKLVSSVKSKTFSREISILPKIWEAKRLGLVFAFLSALQTFSDSPRYNAGNSSGGLYLPPHV